MEKATMDGGEGKEALTPAAPIEYKDRLEKALGGYRGRILRQVEDYMVNLLPPIELETLKRRIRTITADLMDEMRRVIREMEQSPSFDERWTEINARMATLENQNLFLLKRVEALEQGKVINPIALQTFVKGP